jgi:DNA repair exonuclease SbcCD ATPase subunit
VDVDHDTMRFLETEIETLRSELAVRDSQLAELEAMAAAEDNCIHSSEPDQTRHDARWNDLLDELKRGDTRIRTLEDLLQLSEDATQAEQEERRQIEIWIGELEQRVSSREAEWRAEAELLNERIGKLLEEQTQLENQLQNALSGTSANVQEKVIRDLQLDIRGLKEQLATANSKNEELTKQVGSADFQSLLKKNQQLVEAAIREEQLKMSQERAAFSRQKSELLRRVTELERELAERKRPSDNDLRFQAFRDHLKEIHEQERKTGPAAPSLAKRLVDLWKKLDTPIGSS